MFFLPTLIIVPPIIDYSNVIWYPFTKKNKKLKDNVQRRATRLGPEFYDLSYTERLSVLKLFSLEYRRKRGDMIQLFKILNGIGDIQPESMFTLS